jgi:hypothetical protein
VSKFDSGRKRPYTFTFTSSLKVPKKSLSLLDERRWQEMLNIEVQSSTVLSQIELCFICSRFSFFFAKLHSILLPLASVPCTGSPSCKYTAGMFPLSFFFC